MSRKQWVMRNTIDSSVVEELSSQLQVLPVIAHLLYNRNILTPEQAEVYFRPSVEQIHSPMLFRDMEKAVLRLLRARVRNEWVAVYGDSDVDGLSATTILTRFLRTHDWNVIPYLPQRNHIEYGFHCEAVDDLHQQGVQVIVTVDVGTTACKAIEYANSKGITVIVTDHHEQPAELPPAYAIINPKVVEDAYPFRELSGCGVAFKLVQGLALSLQIPFEEITPLLEYVALGTTADIVPVVGENRALLALGFEQLNHSQFPGIKALAESAELEISGIGMDELLLTISPRINAASRMGVPEQALNLLLTDDPVLADQCAIAMEQENYRRRRVDDDMMKAAIQQINSQFDSRRDHAIVLAGEQWYLGVIGILASRIAEIYHRPTAVLAIENGIAKGSVRSVDGLDVYAILDQCKEDLLQFGGHKNAAGMSIVADKVEQFTKRFKDVVSQAIHIDNLKPILYYDKTIELDNIHFDFYEQLSRLAPFGPGNPKPAFLTESVSLIGSPRITASRHLRFKVRQKEKIFSVIGLSMANRIQELNHKPLEICFYIEQMVTHWGPALQLRILDFKHS